ncbi:MAG: YIP1 family protein [Pseudodesulfovibrio sp.]|uniref:YIP1 family protein n=1 Tax=Pseudodesulfovibrio sp. TaxID=2035812 RepID=UPI003D0A3221
MQIICPECRFAREVNESKIPARSQVATCPKCQTKFKFRDLPEPDFIIDEPAPEAAPEPVGAPKPAAEPTPEVKSAPAPEPVTERESPAPPPSEAEAESPADPVLRKLRRGVEPRQGSLMETDDADDTEEITEKTDRAFPGLPDADNDSGDALWQRLHTMTPPEKPRNVYRDEPEPGQDSEQQPVPGWTGEFNEDFPDPMQGEFAEEEDETASASMQVPPPFEQLDRYGFFRGLFLTIKLVLLSPRLFFSVMPVGNGLSKPLTFAILVAMIQSVAQYAWTAVGLMPGIDVTSPDMVAAAPTTADDLFMLLLRPAAVAFEIFFFAGLFHLMLLPLQSAKKGFEGTFRAVAYAYAPIIIGVLPLPLVELVIGNLGLSVLWFLALTAVGLKYIHETSSIRTAGVVVLTVLLLMAVVASMVTAQIATV